MQTAPTIRLGFPVRIVGRPALRINTERPGTHLSINLVQLRDVMHYLKTINVHFYRLPLLVGALKREQITTCSTELADVAALLAAHQLRLTLHLNHGATAPNDTSEQLAQWCEEVEAHAAFLTALDSERGGRIEGIMVAHLGGKAADPAALERFCRAYERLSANAQQRLAIEHDDAGFSLGQLLALHQQCGVAVVFDALHWALHNPERLPLDLALGLALATWPATIRPEVHLSSMRSEAHLLPGKAGQPLRIVPPYPGQHADFIVAEDLRRLLVAARGLPPFDLMLEAKAGDLALLRLRHEIARLEPALATRLN
jgi:UV DNA damage endonuclease